MDLAKRETPSRSIPQTTFNEEITLPRADTRRDSREVNAVIRRPTPSSNAEALAKLLGVAGDAAATIAGQVQANQDKANEAQAVFDFAQGSQNQGLYQKSRAYADAWQLEGAKSKALDIAQKATEKVQEVINNPDATAADADAAIESVFLSETHDAKGNLLDFGTPEAKLALGHSLAEVKAKLMPTVHELLRKRQNERLMGTTLDNMFVERERGAAIGDPNAVQPQITSVITDPLAPLPGPQTAPTHLLGKLSAPFAGFDKVALTGHLGDQRAGHIHNGEDFPVPDGTPIQAPMGGTVISSFNDTQHGGGESVRVKLANGAVVGFAHLSERHVKVGDQVAAGELLGLSGQTGDATGPHVHMTVVVNGKHVSARHYFATHSGDQQLVVATGAEPKLTELPSSTPDPSIQQPGLDVEAFLNRMPPSISKGEAKTWFIQGAIAKAYQTGDASLLNGLENSHRPDGSPSFNPEEQLQIEKARDEIRDHATVEADRAKSKMQGDNLDLILNAYNTGNPPSDTWLAAQGEKGLIDPKQAYTLISHNREMRKQAQSEARYEERVATADREEGITADVNSRATAMMAGEPTALATTDEQLRQEFEAGDFGPVGSKRALANFRTLRTAHHQGVQAVESSPDFKRYAASLAQYAPLPQRSTLQNPLLIPQITAMSAGPHLDKPTYAEMQGFFQEQVAGGKTPGDAYRAAVDKYVRHVGAKSADPMANAVNRLSYLKCKQAGICK